MFKNLSLLIAFVFTSFCSQAQFTRYIVKFRDKGTNPFSIANPSEYLTQRALERRTRYNIVIDSTDLPVTPRYIDSVRLAGAVTVLNSSKWLNQVAIRTSDAAAISKINSFPFVIAVSAIGSRIQPGIEVPVNKQLDAAGTIDIPTPNGPQDITGYYNYGKSNGQVKIHQGDFLHNHGFRGDSIHMSIMDAGFFHYLSLPTFDSVRNNGHILGTWDFVANNASVDEDNSHGMQCFSAIAANMPGVFVGTAPGTKFYLFRTEDVASEYPIEEQNLVAGAERADSLGVDVCSISLGYTEFDNPQFNYTYSDMNGNTSISARGVDLASKKGMLMVVAAGNEGNGSWHYISTPSDADSALCVGAVDTLGVVGGFSSFGPSSDGQVKPSVAAVGSFAVIANTANGQPSYGFGTSFACPNMAGIATCLWQAFPEVSNMDIINVLQLSATRAGNPDDRVGYGIPDAKKAFVMLQRRSYTQQSSIAACKVSLQLRIKTDNTMNILVERKLAGESVYSNITTLTNTGAYGVHDFSYEDDLNAANTGDVWYRFKMQIATDTTFYLDSLIVNHAQGCGSVTENKLFISPNPAYGSTVLNVTRTSAVKIGIVIQNELGQRIYQTTFQQPAGILKLPIRMEHLSKGLYFITVYLDDKKALTEKILRR